MGWLDTLIGVFKSERGREMDILYRESRDLRGEYKAALEELKKENINQEERIKEMERKIAEIMIFESDCHRLLIQERQMSRDLKEENIFLKGKKKET